MWIFALVGAVLAQARPANGQDSGQPENQKMDIDKIGVLLQQLQSQIKDLHAEVHALKAQQQSAKADSDELRKRLDEANAHLIALETPASQPTQIQVVSEPTRAQATTEDRTARLEENQQLADGKIAEQSQTKVESGSKYRVRLSGIALFNMFENRGTVDNADLAQLAVQPGLLSSGSSFGGSLRQSQFGIQAFGPTIAGARTSADVQFDFAGGFPESPNGTSFGIMRLRTGTIRFDWTQTSLVAGQDALFFAPLSPTSIATLAAPAFAYSGNLWGWTPQIRVEHKFTVSDSATLLLQGGLLDSLSGDTPFSTYYRYPSWGESSGQPAYATRVAWMQNLAGQTISLGAGGYYGRQDWGFGRSVDSWAGTIDAKVPLGSKFEFTGQFYRGRGIGGFGAGLGQTAIWSGSLLAPATHVYGLNSMGGWAQLKFKATSKLQFNGAFGLDNPFADDLRESGGNTTYYQFPLSKNESGLVNFIYQPRSDVVLSMEFRRIKTFTLDSSANTANIANFTVGYIF
jgi:outer membrane murein-binding lipoprotein Lpp